MKTEKISVKKQLRQLRRTPSSAEKVRLLAHEFHVLVRRHSKLAKDAKKMAAKAHAKKPRKECHKDLHKFSRKILEDDSRAEAQSFFTDTYSTSPQNFHRPSWMLQPPPPSIPMTYSQFTIEELRSVITKMKSSSSPSPVDQILYTVLKKCPSLWPALLHLFNLCWSTQYIPKAWKAGVIRLLGTVRRKHKRIPANHPTFAP